VRSSVEAATGTPIGLAEVGHLVSPSAIRRSDSSLLIRLAPPRFFPIWSSSWPASAWPPPPSAAMQLHRRLDPYLPCGSPHHLAGLDDRALIFAALVIAVVTMVASSLKPRSAPLVGGARKAEKMSITPR
jgi:hypothetical protein